MKDTIIAIDPGREKCGIAAVHQKDGVLYKEVVETRTLTATVQDLAAAYHLTTIIIGDRTTSRKIRSLLEQIQVNGKLFTIIPVDEHRSTDAARRRYWQENPPRGLKRLIPTTMQVPPVPVDDYVAVILAERYFEGKGREKNG